MSDYILPDGTCIREATIYKITKHMENPSRYIITTKNDKSKRGKTIFASDIGVKYEKLDGCEIPIYAQARKTNMRSSQLNPSYELASSRAPSYPIYEVPEPAYEAPVKPLSEPLYASIRYNGGRKYRRKSKKNKNKSKKSKTYKRSNS